MQNFHSRCFWLLSGFVEYFYFNPEIKSVNNNIILVIREVCSNIIHIMIMLLMCSRLTHVQLFGTCYLEICTIITVFIFTEVARITYAKSINSAQQPCPYLTLYN